MDTLAQSTTGRRHSASRRRRLRRTAAVALVTAVALTGCGGEGVEGLPTTLPTTLPTVTLPTVTLPTVTLPTVTLPTVTLPTVTGPTVTVTEDGPEPTSEAPEPEPTEEETPEPEPEETATAEPTDDAEATDSQEEADEGGSGWLWLLLLLAAAAVAAVVALVRRRRARAAWEAAVVEPLHEARWLRETLVPNLLAQGAQGRAGVWTIGRPRVMTLEQRLGDLVGKATDATTAHQVGALSSAVQALRRALDHADTQPDFGGASTTAAMQQSQSELADVIRALQPPSADGAPAASASTGGDGRP